MRIFIVLPSLEISTGQLSPPPDDLIRHSAYNGDPPESLHGGCPFGRDCCPDFKVLWGSCGPRATGLRDKFPKSLRSGAENESVASLEQGQFPHPGAKAFQRSKKFNSGADVE